MNTNRNIETDRMREMRDRHDERIRELESRQREARDQWQDERQRLFDESNKERQRLLEEHTRKLSDLHEQHRTAIADISHRQAEDRRTYEAQQAADRERLRESHQVQLESIRENYDARLEDLRKSTEREIVAIRSQTQDRVESVRDTERGRADSSKELADQRVLLKESQLADKDKIIEELRREVRDLRDKNSKDAITVLRESKEMAMEFGGLVPADQAGGAEEPSTLSQVMALGKAAFEAAPEIFDRFARARVEQQQAQMQMQMAQQQQQQRMAAPPPMLPGAQAAPAPRYAPPPAATNRARAPLGATPANATYSPPLHNAAVPLGAPAVQVASPVQPASVSSQQAVAPMVTSPEAQSSEQATGPNVLVEPQPPAAAQEATQLAPEHRAALVDLLSQLEQAVAADYPVESFAAALVQQAGPEQAKAFLQQLPADLLFQVAQQAKPDTVIVGRKGQRYVNQLYAEVWKRVGAGA